jgi:hypothetical protein
MIKMPGQCKMATGCICFGFWTFGRIRIWTITEDPYALFVIYVFRLVEEKAEIPVGVSLVFASLRHYHMHLVWSWSWSKNWGSTSMTYEAALGQQLMRSCAQHNFVIWTGEW